MAYRIPTVLKLSGHVPNINPCPQNCAIHVFVRNITHSTKTFCVLALDQAGTRDTKLNKTRAWPPFLDSIGSRSPPNTLAHSLILHGKYIKISRKAWKRWRSLNIFVPLGQGSH